MLFLRYSFFIVIFMQQGWGYWFFIIYFLSAGAFASVLNAPYPLEATSKIRYSSFSEAPKTLDPAKAYSTDASVFVAQIYEPLLQYSYFQRPFSLEPLTLKMLDIEYLDSHKKKLPPDAASDKIAYIVYRLVIKPGIYFQPHPAFARCLRDYCYLALTEKDLKEIKSLSDFSQAGTRELQASDYAYEIKRLASPTVQSPINGLMGQYILGLPELTQTLENYHRAHPNNFLDLRQFDLEGVKIISPYEMEIWIKGKYPEFRYWLAMNFFSPVPWEVDKFYAQKGMAERYLSLDWYPVGTGPFMLLVNNPNQEIVLTRNPNFHQEYFPKSDNSEDIARGYTAHSGKALPLLDKIIFTLEKESIPRWNKFMQGYYDVSGISADSFDQAVKVDNQGNPYLSPELQAKGIHLQIFTEPSIFYLGFNMLDPIVGGGSERARKLRQAISIAIDYEEFISIFMNGRGVPAHGLLPPDIFGYGEGRSAVNEVVYNFSHDGQYTRRSLAEARVLLAEAGYPNGIDPRTGKALLLTLDTTGGGPEEQAHFAWYREQFAKLGITLAVEATQFNRFQEKVRRADTQLFMFGWRADYPDPENFFFLLYGPNGVVKNNGQNVSNYSNPQFDRLFESMRDATSSEEKKSIIEKMNTIIRYDSPWVWGFYPRTFVISHNWNTPTKPHPIEYNLLKYADVDPLKRERLQIEWNQAIAWPLWVGLFVLSLFIFPMVWKYQIKIRKPPKRLD